MGRPAKSVLARASHSKWLPVRGVAQIKYDRSTTGEVERAYAPPVPDVPPVEAPDVPPVEAPDVPPVEAPDVPPVEAPDVPPVEAPDVPPVAG